MITYSKSYQEFIGIVTSKNLIIHKVSDRNSAYYLVAKDGMLFYETYLAKDNGPDHLDFENNYAQRAVNAFPDNSMPVTISSSLFTKPYTNLQVVAKNEFGDPILIKSVHKGQDSQLLTVVYDEDGDLQSATVSDL